MSAQFNLQDLMAKNQNNNSVWQQTKSVFNDTTEIISEVTEGLSETAKAFRKTMNLANLQLDEMIIMQKIGIVGTLMQALVEAGNDKDTAQATAIAIVINQSRN